MWSKEKESASGSKDDKVKAIVVINRWRYFNVLSSDLVRPHLVSLGDNLTQSELDIGLKKNQKLHELVAFEYNREDVPGYDRNAFPNLTRGRSLPSRCTLYFIIDNRIISIIVK